MDTQFSGCKHDRRALALQDLLMVSAFGLWALLLGISPVMIFQALV